MRRLVLPACLLLGLGALPAAADEIADGIAAQVGNEIVLVSDVTQYTDPVEKQLRAAGATDADVDAMKAEVLERLIERRLIDQVVKRAELDASEAEIDQTIAAIAQENGLSVERLQQSVEEGGMPMSVYREKIRGEIQHAKVMNGMVRSRVHVDEAEVKALYQKRYSAAPEGGTEYHLRHILLPFLSEKSSQKAVVCSTARKARQRIAAGESFEAVAAQVSAVNPERGGDVGWVHESNLAGWMVPIVRQLTPGQTSDVVESSYGCNLMELVEKRAFENRSYDQVRDQLYEELFRERMDVEYGRWIDKLRSQAFIERKGIFATADRPLATPAVSGAPSPSAPPHE